MGDASTRKRAGGPRKAAASKPRAARTTPSVRQKIRNEAKRVAVVAVRTTRPFVPPGTRDWGPSTMLVDKRPGVAPLLRRIKRSLPKLERTLQHYDSHWGFEDPVYRFYHQSWKVYGIEDATLHIVETLKALSPGSPLNEWFMQIVERGCPWRPWKREDNARWVEVNAPKLEAFFHARFFLEMAVRYGKELKEPIQPMPSGWAALLYLYNL